MPKRDDIQKVMIISSGPIVIGQACEFDYSGTQACKALRKLGYEIVLVNSNPATIMTDPGMADVTYIEPLTVDAMEEIVAKLTQPLTSEEKKLGEWHRDMGPPTYSGTASELQELFLLRDTQTSCRLSFPRRNGSTKC